jgi:hypothetical protein
MALEPRLDRTGLPVGQQVDDPMVLEVANKGWRRRQAQSSVPITPAGTAASMLRCRTARSSVAVLTSSIRQLATGGTAGRPPSANPRYQITSCSRAVRRAERAISLSSRSVKVCRGQAARP